MSRNRPFFSTTFFTALGRAGGFIIPFFVAFYYGITPETDAFFFAYALIIFLTELSSQIFESMLIPYLAEHKKNPETVSHFANGVALLSLPFAAIICFLIHRFLPPALIRWSRWDASSASLSAGLFLQITPLFFLNLWSSVMNGIFYTYKVFWYPALSPLIRSVWVILFLWLGHQKFGITALTFGFVAGESIRLLTGFLLSRYLKLWVPKFRWEEVRFSIKEFLQKVPLQIFAVTAVLLTPVVNQWFAARLGVGSVSLLNYAERLLLIPYQLFIGGFLQIFLSDWSEGYCQEPGILFWPKIQKDIQNTFLAALVLSLILVIFHNPLVRMVYGHGELQEKELPVLASVFGWLAIGFAPAVINLLYVRTLFVLKKTSFYSLQSWVKLSLHLFLNYVLMQFYGVKGIAMSTSIVYILMGLWIHFYLKGIAKDKEGLKRQHGAY